jgi:hypothetical protein
MKKFLVPLFFVLMLAMVFSIKAEPSNAFGSAVNPENALLSDNQYAKIYFFSGANSLSVNGFSFPFRKIKTVEIGVEYRNCFCLPDNFLLEVSFDVKGNAGTPQYFKPKYCEETIEYFDITNDVPIGSKWTKNKIKNLTASVKTKILWSALSENPNEPLCPNIKIDQVFLRINKR